MSTRTDYQPGQPSWVNVTSPRLSASAEFYERLFGWRFEAAGDPDAANGYGIFKQSDRSVASGGSMPGDSPGAWTVYFTVDDIEQTTAGVRSAGGGVVYEPAPVLDVGRMAIFTDPSGAEFAVWQPLKHRGAELTGEPVSLAWSELITRDTDGAKTFYESVFGWRAEPWTMPTGDEYVQWMLDDEPVAGMYAMADDRPADAPAYWMTYFAVDDPDATAATAADLGGAVTAGPFDVVVGRKATVSDPFGAAFSVIKFTPRDGSD